MKSLKSILEASILADIDDQLEAGDEYIKEQIRQFIEENYKGSVKISSEPNKDGKYEVSSTGEVIVKNNKITSLTNGYFVFTEVGGNFDCRNCYSLKSLEGAPRKVKGYFMCWNCYELISLVGAPEEVGGNLLCSGCHSLTSLEGCPKKVKSIDCSVCKNLKSLEGCPKELKLFDCTYCESLTTLKGGPEKVEDSFLCSGCHSLTSLEYAPKKVGDSFYCSNCKSQFTKNDVKKVSDVKGKIFY